MPLFSIITVTLNCAADAVQTAESVLAQSYRDIEYIVKDGGSNDGTTEQLRALPGIQVYGSPDSGVYDAMNQALALCTGEYICFMNAGDSFAGPDVLAIAADAIQRTGRPELLYGDVRSLVRHPDHAAAETLAQTGREIRYPNRLSRAYLFRKMICHQAWFVQRASYAAIGGFDPRYRILGDYACLLTLILARHARYAHIPSIVAIYQGGGLSERGAAIAHVERESLRQQFFRGWERALYGSIASRWMPSIRRLVIMRAYHHMPTALRKRLNGW